MVIVDQPASWLLRLRIRHLEVFRELVRTGSQSETAARMHLTQPALSKWLRELEEQAGCALFTRERPLRLTVHGEVLLRYAERVLGDSLRTGKELEAIQAGSSGLLRVGVLRAVAPLLVPRAILRCRQEAPRLQIRLHEDSLDNLLPQLRRHELDCVIGRLHGQALGPEFRSEALYEEPVRAVVRPGHPLLQKQSRLTLADAAAYPWILPLPGIPMRVRLEAEFAASNTRMPLEQIESVSLVINETLLRESDMVSVVSHQLAQHYERFGSLAILPLPMRQALGPVGLLWTDAQPSNAVQRFLQSVRLEAASLARTGASRGKGSRRPSASSRASARAA
ncbi:LysR substrate-binding domain-containing protein [Ramlibacter sp.]|uniref:LysR substrate-binding domain-containing protein n=1 Tax=Ramlibacter sp. TaxID=1917967 RepID=UPI002FC8F8EF